MATGEDYSEIREAVSKHFTEARKHESDWVTVGFAYSINGKPVAVPVLGPREQA